VKPSLRLRRGRLHGPARQGGRPAALGVTGHALIDGNKRLGWVSVRLFYRVNGSDLRVPADDAFDLVASIADGSLRDVQDIADRLRAWVVDIEGADWQEP
jgi:Prophage maintenance system killer protein